MEGCESSHIPDHLYSNLRGLTQFFDPQVLPWLKHLHLKGCIEILVFVPGAHWAVQWKRQDVIRAL